MRGGGFDKVERVEGILRGGTQNCAQPEERGSE